MRGSFGLGCGGRTVEREVGKRCRGGRAGQPGGGRISTKTQEL
jgi:hypothetical protein